jgi:SAM-dependent methyltransferase
MAGRPSQAERFDRAYYDRFYRDPKTRVHTHLEIEVLARFVFAYLEIAGIEPRRVVDLGCGLGFWRDLAAVHAPRARYVGVEISEYVCREFGWKQGSVVDFHLTWPGSLLSMAHASRWPSGAACIDSGCPLSGPKS